jgi:hypothetical protein
MRNPHLKCRSCTYKHFGEISPKRAITPSKIVPFALVNKQAFKVLRNSHLKRRSKVQTSIMDGSDRMLIII